MRHAQRRAGRAVGRDRESDKPRNMGIPLSHTPARGVGAWNVRDGDRAHRATLARARTSLRAESDAGTTSPVEAQGERRARAARALFSNPMRTSLPCLAGCALLLAASSSALTAQTPDFFSSAMHWRAIGPTRAGRARALAGVPTQPNVFYAGYDNGGVWRSTDYGSTWVPLFDKEPTGSIGAIAVAPSDPSVIYVGTGAGIIRPDLAVGDGVYKSTDAGK